MTIEGVLVVALFVALGLSFVCGWYARQAFLYRAYEKTMETVKAPKVDLPMALPPERVQRLMQLGHDGNPFAPPLKMPDDIM